MLDLTTYLELDDTMSNHLCQVSIQFYVK
jgi:hypothetical protein